VGVYLEIKRPDSAVVSESWASDLSLGSDLVFNSRVQLQKQVLVICLIKKFKVTKL